MQLLFLRIVYFAIEIAVHTLVAVQIATDVRISKQGNEVQLAGKFVV